MSKSKRKSAVVKGAGAAVVAAAAEARVFEIGLGLVKDYELGLPVGSGGKELSAISQTEFARRCRISSARVSQMVRAGAEEDASKQQIRPINTFKKGKVRYIHILGAAEDIHATRNNQKSSAALRGNLTRRDMREEAERKETAAAGAGSGFSLNAPAAPEREAKGEAEKRNLNALYDLQEGRKVTLNQDILVKQIKLGEALINQQKRREEFFDRQVALGMVSRLFRGFHHEVLNMDSDLTNVVMAEFPELDRVLLNRAHRRGLRGFLLRTAEKLDHADLAGLTSGFNGVVHSHMRGSK